MAFLTMSCMLQLIFYIIYFVNTICAIIMTASSAEYFLISGTIVILSIHYIDNYAKLLNVRFVDGHRKEYAPCAKKK